MAKQPPKTLAFRKAQRDLFATARSYVYASMNSSRAEPERTNVIESWQDHLANAAVAFAFAAAEYAEAATFGGVEPAKATL